MKLFPLLECENEARAIKVASFFKCQYVFTGNPKPYLVVGTKETADMFEQFVMETTFGKKQQQQ